MKKQIKIGTRGSSLALAQTNEVAAALQARFPDVETETVILQTRGDRILDRPLTDFGDKGVFTAEFEDMVGNGKIDLAVHSAKDMPMELGTGLMVAGVMPRADARDVLVTRKGSGCLLAVGTGSPRRQSQLRRLFSQAVCRGIRGNVATRLSKLRNGEYDGLILAAAGLERLGLLREEDLEYRFFSFDEMVPAGGQGIIAVEGRREDEISNMVRAISDSRSYYELEIERKVLGLLDAGCQEAVGVVAQCGKDSVRIRLIREVNGRIFKMDETAGFPEAGELAVKMAESALASGFSPGKASK